MGRIEAGRVELKVVNVKLLKLEPDLQPRVKHNESVIEDYATLLKENVILPPPVVFADGKKYLLADGFHRVLATIKAGFETIQCEVHEGGKREAILYSCGANAAHGLPRTNEDKHRAVTSMVLDPEWRKWSNRQIAKHCGVSEGLVRTVRQINGQKDPEDNGDIPVRIKSGSQKPRENEGFESLTAHETQSKTDSEAGETRTYIHNKSGKPTQMKVGNIQKSGQARATQNADEPVDDSEFPEGWEGVFEVGKKILAIRKQFGELRREVQFLADLPGGEALKSSLQHLEIEIKSIQNTLSGSAPAELCPYCGGKKCGTCNQRGWVASHQAKTAEKMREAV